MSGNSRSALAVVVAVFFLLFVLVRREVPPDDRPAHAPVLVAPLPRPVSEPAAAARERFFPVRPGARWVYDEDGREWAQVVTAVTAAGDDWVVSVDHLDATGKVTGRETLRATHRGLTRLEEDGVPCTPPIKLLEVPSWLKLDVTDAAGGDDFLLDGSTDLLIPPTGNGQAAGRETVRVPAGEFRAVRVDGGSLSPPADSLVIPVSETRWYAPNVGLVKRTLTASGRSENLSELVLKSFAPGPK